MYVPKEVLDAVKNKNLKQSETKAPRRHARSVKANNLLQMRNFFRTQIEMASILGMSDTAVSNYLSEGFAPKYVEASASMWLRLRQATIDTSELRSDVENLRKELVEAAKAKPNTETTHVSTALELLVVPVLKEADAELVRNVLDRMNLPHTSVKIGE
jgi:predicted transcriptional regulator